MPATGTPTAAKILKVLVSSPVNPSLKIQIIQDFVAGKTVTVSEVPSGALNVELILVDHLDQRVAAGSASTVVKGGAINPLSISLTPVTPAKGTLDIKVEWTGPAAAPNCTDQRSARILEPTASYAGLFDLKRDDCRTRYSEVKKDLRDWAKTRWGNSAKDVGDLALLAIRAKLGVVFEETLQN